MASKQIRQQVTNIVNNGRGKACEKLETLEEELTDTAEDEEETPAIRQAAKENREYVRGYRETPAALLADLTYIRKKHNRT